MRLYIVYCILYSYIVIYYILTNVGHNNTNG
jgi:hypothetical protein